MPLRVHLNVLMVFSVKEVTTVIQFFFFFLDSGKKSSYLFCSRTLCRRIFTARATSINPAKSLLSIAPTIQRFKRFDNSSSLMVNDIIDTRS